MSKSLGSLVFVREILHSCETAVLRVALMSHHYRDGFEWSPTMLNLARELVAREFIRCRIRCIGCLAPVSYFSDLFPHSSLGSSVGGSFANQRQRKRARFSSGLTARSLSSRELDISRPEHRGSCGTVQV